MLLDILRGSIMNNMNIDKSIVNYYPDILIAGDLKVFQDRTSQIKGVYFKRGQRHNLNLLDIDSKYILYFLFTNTNDMYIDGAVGGLDRVIDDIETDESIRHVLLFTSDDDGNFSQRILDYLVFIFQEMFLDAGYFILNDRLMDEFDINLYDQPVYDKYRQDIEYLLHAEGYMRRSKIIAVPPQHLEMSESKNDNKRIIKQNSIHKPKQITSEIEVPRTVSVKDENDVDFIKYYYPKDSFYDAKVHVVDDRGPNKRFILDVGSVIRRPLPQTKSYKDSGFYDDYNKRIDHLVKKNRIELHDSSLSEYKVLQPIGFKKPSPIACLVAGTPQNGWKFFNGLSRIR